MKNIIFKIYRSNFLLWDAIFLALVSLFLGTINLGNVALRDWDEGYYGTVSQDMFYSGDWVYPTYLGEPFLLKPPLTIWLITLSYHLGGINEFTSRFPCALISALSIPLLYLIGREVWQNRSSAILSACVYLTLLAVIRHGRLAMIDGMINTFFLISLLGIVKSYQSRLWLILVGMGLGLIALSKGTLVIPLGGILLVFILWQYSFKRCLSPYLWLGFLIGFTPVGLWYGLQIQHYGDAFIKVHFIEQNFSRLSTAVEGNRGGVGYYVWEILKYTAPWLFFLPSSLWINGKSLEKKGSKLVILGIILYFGLISVMQTKLPWYIMPLYPFFALSVGHYLGLLWENSVNYPRWIGWILMGIGGLSSVGLIYFIQTQASLILGLVVISLGLTLFLAGLKLYHKNRQFIPILIIGLSLSLSLFFFSNDWVWELNEAFAVKPVGKLLKNYTPRNTVIYTSFDYSRPSLDFYSQRKVISADDNRLKELLTSQNYLLLEREVFDQLQLENPSLLGEAEGFLLVRPSHHP